MIKNETLFLCVCAIACFMSGCASSPFQPAIFANDHRAFSSAPFNHATKHESSCIYIIAGLVSWGDASITAAKEYREFPDNGATLRMSRVSHIDLKRKILLRTGYFKTVAYGLLP